MESGNLCYVCRDKRRSADTDAAQTKYSSKPYEDSYKDILLKVITGGVDEEIEEGENEVKTDSLGNISISLQSNFAVEVLYKKVEDESHIFICRRCEILLKDFEHHERKASSLGETIRTFITKRENTETVDSNSSNPPTGICRGRKLLDEKRGIQAAFRALKRTNPIIRRGRKRKELNVPSEKSGTSDNEETEKIDDIGTSEQEKETSAGTRASKRIQRRREDGLVIRWGDVHGETTALETQTESKGGGLEETFLPDDTKPRRRGRKPNSSKLMKTSQDINKISGVHNETSLKHQCPFCFRYYIPSLSRIHGCISYKNQLRCLLCNIFFTSYIRLEKHLEVIHLKGKELKCTEAGCNFTCISQPAIILHDHFHRLNEQDGGSHTQAPGSGVELGLDHIVVTAELEAGEGVTLINDDLGSVCSPDTVEQVSFQLDEKSLVSGQPVDITVNTIKIKSAVRDLLETDTETSLVTLKCDSCNLQFKSKGDFDAHMQEVHLSVAKGSSIDNSCEVKTDKQVKYTFLNIDAREIPEVLVKQNALNLRETFSSVSLREDSETDSSKSKLKCPCCDKQLMSQKDFDDHVRNFHNIIAKHSMTDSGSGIQVKDGRPIKYNFLSVDSRETPLVSVKKNFGTPQNPLWIVGKTKALNR